MEEPGHYYDDYKNHIQSKLTNEICKLFNVLKQDTISSLEVKNTILVLSTNVFEYLNNCKEEKVYNYIEELSNIEYEIKELKHDIVNKLGLGPSLSARRQVGMMSMVDHIKIITGAK